MPVEFKEWKDDGFKVLLETFKHAAKLSIERMELIRATNPDSAEHRVHYEFLQKELVPKMNELGGIVYGFITSYNDHPEHFPSYSRKDVLDAELALDEVLILLRSAGINVIINREPSASKS